jgi:ribosomal protein L40E
MGVVFIAVIFILVTIAAAVIVGGWVLWNIGRGVKRVIVGPAAKPQSAMPANRAVCSRGDCRADNPIGAQFCRRCGEPLAHTPVRGMKVA